MADTTIPSLTQGVTEQAKDVFGRLLETTVGKPDSSYLKDHRYTLPPTARLDCTVQTNVPNYFGSRPLTLKSISLSFAGHLASVAHTMLCSVTYTGLIWPVTLT